MSTFWIPKETLATSMRSEKCFTNSLMGASTWPGANVAPIPAGMMSICVPCRTEMTPLMALALAKLTNARLSPASTCCVAGASSGANHEAISSASKQRSKVTWRAIFILYSLGVADRLDYWHCRQNQRRPTLQALGRPHCAGNTRPTARCRRSEVLAQHCRPYRPVH